MMNLKAPAMLTDTMGGTLHQDEAPAPDEAHFTCRVLAC